jgi:LuxR family maltose regulon positive regulatory protein
VLQRGEGETFRRWLAAIPPEVVRAYPRLCLAQAIAALSAGHIDAVESLLDDAERGLSIASSTPYTPSIGPSMSMLANVPAGIALLRAGVAGSHGDATRTRTWAHAALALLAEHEQGPRVSVRWNRAIAAWIQGNVEEAERAFAALMADGRSANQPNLALGAASARGRIQRAQGRLDAALRSYQSGLVFATHRGGPPVLSAAMMHVGMAEVLYERNQLDQALHHITDGIALGRQFTATQALATGLATLAWMRHAQNDAAGALDAMEEAYQVVPSLDVVALHNPVPAERARFLLAQGELADVAHWVAERGLDAADDPRYPREQEYLVLVRLLLARHAPERALPLLVRLGAAARAQGRMGSLIAVLVLEALARAATGDDTRALAVLVDALSMARPQGYVRVFANEGPAMAHLLRRLIAAGAGGRPATAAALPIEYLGHLLRVAEQWRTPPSVPAPRTNVTLLPMLEDALTERESEVLALLIAGKQNREIADALVVTVDTVKKHITHILDKLGATNRTEAVARARALGLIA